MHNRLDGSEPNGPNTTGGEGRQPSLVGRGAQLNPHNRFEKIQLQHFDEFEQEETLAPRKIPTTYFQDDTRTILSENSSPDIPFRYSLNPYRGCLHGCAYCYARPTHEYLGFSAGVDFESKIMVKRKAPELLRARLRSKSWQPEPIIMSGATDCYQPIEKELQITRGCIQVASEYNQPINVVTKNALVTRDLDILASMAEKQLARVAISITSLDQSLTRTLEPRTSSPQARLNTIRQLSDAGVDVTVMIAPLIPGLNDDETAQILEASKDHGAKFSSYVLLRLPLTVAPLFMDWLSRNRPMQKDKIESLIQQTRSGKLNQTEFAKRMRGTGKLADLIKQSFAVFSKRAGLARQPPPLRVDLFHRPPTAPTQLELF